MLPCSQLLKILTSKIRSSTIIIFVKGVICIGIGVLMTILILILNKQIFGRAAKGSFNPQAPRLRHWSVYTRMLLNAIQFLQHNMFPPFTCQPDTGCQYRKFNSGNSVTQSPIASYNESLEVEFDNCYKCLPNGWCFLTAANKRLSA